MRFAREREVIISAIMDTYTHKAQAPAGSEDITSILPIRGIQTEQAFSNITWDLGDDLDSFRDEAWAHEMGTFLVNSDPYRHLATSHPVHRKHQDRASDWFGFYLLHPELVASAARLDAGGAADPNQNGPDHSASQRRVWV